MSDQFEYSNDSSSLELTPLCSGDLEFVRQLRNKHCEWFFDNRPITKDSQHQWFVKFQNQTSVQFLIIRVDDRPCGTISLTDRGDAVEIGNLTLIEECCGRGLMGRVIEMLLQSHKKYIANVKPENIRSITLFERLGFTQTSVLLERQAANMEPRVPSQNTPSADV